MKILYVEDELPHVELARRTLEKDIKKDFILLHAESYKDAIKLLSEDPDIDLVLTDFRLPDGSGMDLLKKIRELKLPPAVVLVTGQGDEQVAVAALKAGAADYLVKQSDYLHRLPVVITNAVAQHKLEQEQAAKQEAEIRYQSLVEQTPAVVFLDNAEENESTIYISPRIEELTGFTPEEWKSDEFFWENHLHPEDRDRISEADRRTHQTGNRFEEEYRFIRRDGETIWIKENTNLIRDKQGSPLFWQGIMLDVTKEKETAAALERQLKELTVLNAVTLAGAEGSSEDEIIERVVKLSTLVYKEMCGVLLLNEKGDILTPHPSYHGANVSNWMDGVPISQGVTGRSVQTGKTIRLGDVTQDPTYLEIGAGIQSELCVPIQVNKRIIGIFNVESKQPSAFDGEDEQFLTTVAGSLGTSLERLRLFREQQQLYKAADTRRQEAEALQEATATLSYHIEIKPLFDQILESAHKIVPYDSASIFLGTEDSDMEIVTARGFPEDVNLIGLVIPSSVKWLRLAEKKKPLIIQDAQNDPLFEKWTGSEKIRGWMGVPMVAQDKVIGFINFDSHRVNAYTERDATLAQTFANSAAVAIQNAKSFAAEREQRQREETMLELMRVTTSTLELNEVMQTILKHIVNLIPSDSGTIQLLEGNELLIAAAQGFEKGILVPGQMLKLQDSPIKQKTLLTKRPVWTNNTKENSQYKVMSGAENVQAFMAIPLVYKGEAIGLATLDSHSISRYTQEDADFAIAIANQAAIAIGNAKLYQEALMASERRAVLHRISQDVVRFTQDPEQAYKAIHEAAENLMPCDVFIITLQNEASDESVYVYTMEEGAKHTLRNQPADDGLPGMVIKLGKSIILKNDQEIASKGFPRFGSEKHVNSVVAVPMRAGDRIIGMISAQSYLSNSYDTEEQSLLEMLATHAATAIENIRLYNETQRRLKELETINKLSSSMRTTHSQTEMCKRLLDETLELLKADSGSVWVYQPSTNMLVQRAARGMASNIVHKRLKPDEGIVGHVFSNGIHRVSTNIKNDPLLFEGNRSAFLEGVDGVAIPLYSTDGILGVLMVETESSQQIERHVGLLTTLAGIVGNAIHRADLFDQSQDQVHKLTTLRDIDSAIASSTDIRVTLNILMDHTLRQLKVDAADILLYHPELQNLSYFCSTGFKTPSPSRQSVRVGEGLAGQVVVRGKIVQIPDLRETANRDPFLLREGFISYIGIPLIVKGQIKGLFEIFSRAEISPDHEWMQFMQTLAGQAAIAIDNSQLFDNLQRSNQEIRQAYDTTLEGWAKALELRDRETEGHARRVTELTMRLALHMNISEDELIHINRGVLLHDIGKMGVPDQILRKTGPLTDPEWSEMRKHPQYAYDLLSPIPYLRPALDIPYCHHEHWDGSGYPRGLKGTQIPLPARIFSVVDIWDALLSDRSYRKAWSQDKVLEYLKEVSGTILDPAVVETFLEMLGKDEILSEQDVD